MIGGTPEAGFAPTCSDDVGSAQELGALHRDEPDRARRAEHEDVLTPEKWRPPRERQPAGEPGYPQRGRERGIRALGHIDRVRVTDGCPFGECTARSSPQRATEDPDDPAVGSAADGLATRYVRQLRMAARERTA
jgi:hypothetical protein